MKKCTNTIYLKGQRWGLGKSFNRLNFKRYLKREKRKRKIYETQTCLLFFSTCKYFCGCDDFFHSCLTVV